MPADYRLLWFAGLLSALGAQMSALAMPLLVLAETGSPAKAGLVGSIAYLTALAAAVPAGAAVDHFDRRRLLLACESALVVITACLALGVFFELVGLATILAATAVAAVVGTVTTPCTAALLRDLVPEERLATAMSQFQARIAAARVVGPLAGGALYGMSASAAFMAQAMLVATSLACVLSIRTPSLPQRSGHLTSPRQLLAGFAVIWRQPFIRTTLIVFGVGLNAAFAAAMLAVVATSGLRDPSGRTTSIILTLTGVGTLIGSLAAADPRLHRHPRACLLAACWAATVAISVIALVPGSITAGVVISISLIAATVGNVAFLTLATQLTPAHLLGRMQAAAMLLSSLATPIGPIAGGLCLELLGPQATFFILGALLALGAAFTSASRNLPRTTPAGSVSLTV